MLRYKNIGFDHFAIFKVMVGEVDIAFTIHSRFTGKLGEDQFGCALAIALPKGAEDGRAAIVGSGEPEF